jgi:hypothetical protein
MSSTLVFCTSYFRNQAEWERRYTRWLEHHRKVFPREPLVMIDDGSEFLPDEPGISINTDVENFQVGSRASIFHFPNRVGRVSMHNFPGWFRSFTFSVVIAKKLNLKKIVHIESDAFILSRPALEHINGTSNGWIAFWCPKWRIPESAFQVICEDNFASLEEVRNSSFATRFANKVMERALPYTRVDKSLCGNRYGEFRNKVPSYADYAAQINPDMRFVSDFN